MEQQRVIVVIKISPVRLAIMSGAATAGVMGTMYLGRAFARAFTQSAQTWDEATKRSAEQV